MSLLGVAGFALLLGGLYGIIVAMTNARKAGVDGSVKSKKSRKSGSYFDRAEERFRNRRDGFS